MTRSALVLVFLTATPSDAAPVPEHLFASVPEPVPVVTPPPVTTTRTRRDSTAPVGWLSRPNRTTRFWRDVGGVLRCDDPHCRYCAPHVYERVPEWRGFEGVPE